MADTTHEGINRRDFIAATALGFCALCAAGGIPMARADNKVAAQPKDVGAKADFDKDGFTMTWVNTDHFIVARENGKLYAMTSRCTHRGVDLTVAGDHLTCTRHHSNFAAGGTVINGPARKSLVRYAISVNADGHVMVDPSQSFDDQHWNDPKSFVTVDAPASQPA